jgi:hypothetical protein
VSDFNALAPMFSTQTRTTVIYPTAVSPIIMPLIAAWPQALCALMGIKFDARWPGVAGLDVVGIDANTDAIKNRQIRDQRQAG